MASKDDEWEDIPASESDWEDVAPVSQPNQMEDFADRVDADYERRRPSKFDSVQQGLTQGVFRDWGDEAMAKAASLFGGVDYETALAFARDKARRAQNENPSSYNAGEFTGAVAAAPLVLNPLGAAGLAAAEGGARSLGKADKLDASAFGEAGVSGAIDAGITGAINRYAPGLGSYIGSKLAPTKEFLSGVAGRRAVKALGPNMGQINKLNKKGLTEKVGNYALDEGIVNRTRTNAGMEKEAERVLERLGEESRPVYQQAANHKLGKEWLQAQVAKRQADLMQEPGMVPVAEKLGKYGKQLEMGRDAYNPSDIKQYRQAVSRGINFNTKPNSQMGADEFRKILREQEMSLIDRAKPGMRDVNEDLFRRIRLSKEIEPIAERGESRSLANNLMGLRSTGLAGVVGGITTGATGDPAFGAMVGGAVGLGSEITRRYWDQNLAVSARQLSNLVDSDKYRPLFESALKRGGTAIPVLIDQILREEGYAPE